MRPRCEGAPLLPLGARGLLPGGHAARPRRAPPLRPGAELDRPGAHAGTTGQFTLGLFICTWSDGTKSIKYSSMNLAP